MIAQRFRGFLPIIIDVETGGVDPSKDALLELAAVSVTMDPNGLLQPDQTYHYHVEPFEKAGLDPAALAFNKIDPFHPFRFAKPEKQVLPELFQQIQKEVEQKKCTRAVVVGHNAWFDHHFLNAAIRRNKIKKHPFHRFTSFDTATLSGLAFGQTVLSKALKVAQIPFDSEQAHSALYDAKVTAELFCYIVNQWGPLKLPPSPAPSAAE